MQCSAAFGMLDAYLDGELSTENTAAIQDHLRVCTRCSAQIAETARLKRAMRQAAGHFAPSPEFRQRMQKQISRSRRRTWFRPWIPVAAGLVATVLLVLLLVNHKRTSDAIAEIADLHVNALASTNQVDVVSTDRHTVKPWFQGRIPFTFNLPELSGTDFTLIGGRMVYFHQHPGAQLIVSLRQHKISVLIFQNAPDLNLVSSQSSAVDRRTSFAMETWQSQGLRFVLVSDADPSAIDNLATLLKTANQ